MNAKKILAVSAVMMMATAGLSACSSDSGGSGGDGDVSMTFWHNSTTGPGKEYWEKTVAD